VKNNRGAEENSLWPPLTHYVQQSHTFLNKNRITYPMQKPKGTKDYNPAEKIIRNKVVKVIQSSFERYGFAPLETSTLERLETLTSKYAGGNEIVKEIYTLKDQGKRDLGLRYDLTVPLARYIGMNPTLKLPFKRYEIGKVFRDGPIKKGRLREFWQCDGDVIGSASMLTDAEMLAMAQDVFTAIGLEIVIRVNNRKLLNGMIAAAGIRSGKNDAILSLDKLEKFGKTAVRQELMRKKFQKKAVSALLKMIETTGTNTQILKTLKKKIKSDEGKQGVKEIKQLLDYCALLKTKVVFDPSLARGLAYYTGTIYEVFLTEKTAKKAGVGSSLAAGGRWDTMIPQFLNSKRAFPAVGISFGLEPITTALDKKGKRSPVQVFVVPIKTEKSCIALVKRLRGAGVNTDIGSASRSIGKNLNYADAYEIPVVLLVGEEEVKKNKVKLKDLKSGKEAMLSVDKAIAILRKQKN
jgi:histidyl-tRNA synthetase